MSCLLLQKKKDSFMKNCKDCVATICIYGILFELCGMIIVDPH